MGGAQMGERSSSARVLVTLGWLAAALVAATVWTTIGFFALMPVGAVVPLGDPEQVPMWLAYAGLAFLGFGWPLILLALTQRMRTLNRMLMVVYAIAAFAVMFSGGLVVFARSMNTPAQRVLAAALLLGAVGVNALLVRRAARP